MENSKVLILLFPVGKIGGIKTALDYFMLGLRELGIYYEFYPISLNISRKPKKTIGFEKEEWLEEYYTLVKKFDIVIFFTPCPHEGKNYHSENWKKLYNIDNIKIAYIHDAYIDRYYAWYKEIPKKYEVRLITPWQHMWDSIKDIEAMKRLIPNPFREEKGIFREMKKNLVIDPNNWKLAKRKIDLIKIANKVEGKIISFGDTKELPFYLAKKEPNFSKVEHRGWVEREVVLENLKSAKVVVDLLITPSNTVFDYVILEGISKGCIPLTYLSSGCKYFKTAVVEKNCLACLYKTINLLLKNFAAYEDLIEFNLKNLDKLEPRIIIEEVLNYSKEFYKIEKTKKIVLF